MPGLVDDTVLDTPASAPAEAPDRRDVIEQALEASEAAGSGNSGGTDASVAVASTPVAAANDTPPPVPDKTGAPTTPVEPKPGETAPAQGDLPIDKAPQAWRAPQRAKWDKLDPDIRQEVMRRERETSKAFGDSAQARQFATQFHQVTQPFQARLQSMNAHPLAAVQALLRADYTLSTAPKAARAQFMARLINDYGIDILELDAALAGKGSPADPVAAQVEQMLQQRLAPLQTYITQQQQLAQQREQATEQQIGQTIEQMASNPKYPHFETLKEDMADLIDIASKRGVYLSLEDAYTRATAMNPEVHRQVTAQQQKEAQRTSAQAANAAAQKALAASVSVSGSPNGAITGAPAGGASRRQAIEAAFDAIGGR